MTARPMQAMYGIHVKCDRCGVTLGGEQVTPKMQGIPPLTRRQGTEMRAAAAERGWTRVGDDTDHCPACSNPVIAQDGPGYQVLTVSAGSPQPPDWARE